MSNSNTLKESNQEVVLELKEINQEIILEIIDKMKNTNKLNRVEGIILPYVKKLKEGQFESFSCSLLDIINDELNKGNILMGEENKASNRIGLSVEYDKIIQSCKKKVDGKILTHILTEDEEKLRNKIDSVDKSIMVIMNKLLSCTIKDKEELKSLIDDLFTGLIKLDQETANKLKTEIDKEIEWCLNDQLNEVPFYAKEEMTKLNEAAFKPLLNVLKEADKERKKNPPKEHPRNVELTSYEYMNNIVEQIGDDVTVENFQDKVKEVKELVEKLKLSTKEKRFIFDGVVKDLRENKLKPEVVEPDSIESGKENLIPAYSEIVNAIKTTGEISGLEDIAKKYSDIKIDELGDIEEQVKIIVKDNIINTHQIPEYLPDEEKDKIIAVFLSPLYENIMKIYKHIKEEKEKLLIEAPQDNPKQNENIEHGRSEDGVNYTRLAQVIRKLDTKKNYSEVIIYRNGDSNSAEDCLVLFDKEELIAPEGNMELTTEGRIQVIMRNKNICIIESVYGKQTTKLYRETSIKNKNGTYSKEKLEEYIKHLIQRFVIKDANEFIDNFLDIYQFDSLDKAYEMLK